MVVIVTKRQAVVAQIDGAIRAYNEGDHVCAITLAGAAEEAMPKAPEGRRTIFSASLDAFLGRPDWFPDGKKGAVRWMNVERDWLKHNAAAQPDQIELRSSLLMLARSLSRLLAVYGEEGYSPVMRKFLGAVQLPG